MAIMFGSSIFMIPQLIFGLMHYFYKDNESLTWLYINLNMSKPLESSME